VASLTVAAFNGFEPKLVEAKAMSCGTCCDVKFADAD
jgi:hypothetical protein